jgi:hypothetical protein
MKGKYCKMTIRFPSMHKTNNIQLHISLVENVWTFEEKEKRMNELAHGFTIDTQKDGSIQK